MIVRIKPYSCPVPISAASIVVMLDSISFMKAVCGLNFNEYKNPFRS